MSQDKAQKQITKFLKLCDQSITKSKDTLKEMTEEGDDDTTAHEVEEAVIRCLQWAKKCFEGN